MSLTLAVRHGLRLRRTLIAGSFPFLLGLHGCAGVPESADVPAAAARQTGKNYETLLASAEREVRRADAQGFLWLHTESYLTAAKTARAAGDIDRALMLARKALDEALLAQKQAAESTKVKADFSFRR